MMSERLTDEQLAEVAATNGSMWTMSECSSLVVKLMADELRDRRSRDLTDEDRATLTDASGFFVIAMTQAQAAGSDKGAESAARILALLDRLLTPPTPQKEQK